MESLAIFAGILFLAVLTCGPLSLYLAYCDRKIMSSISAIIGIICGLYWYLALSTWIGIVGMITFAMCIRSLIILFERHYHE